MVFIVRKIDDHEYGCRNIEKVFGTFEDAQEYVNNCGEQFDYKFWNGTIEPNLIIEEYEVE